MIQLPNDDFICNRCKLGESFCRCADPHWVARKRFRVPHGEDCQCLDCQWQRKTLKKLGKKRG